MVFQGKKSDYSQEHGNGRDVTSRPHQAPPQPTAFRVSFEDSDEEEEDDYYIAAARKSAVARNTKWFKKFADFEEGGVGSGKGGGTRKNAGTSHTRDNWAENLAKGGWNALPFFGAGKTFWGRNLWEWLKKPKYHFCDLVDRLNCSFTPAIILFLVVLVSANLYGVIHDSPIKCLKSTELTEEQNSYALDICKTKSLYSTNPDKGIPWDKGERRRREIGYYHWVPLTLILQAILFYLPNWLWVHLNRRGAGVDFAGIIGDSCELKEGKDVQKFNNLVDKISMSAMNRLSRRLRRFRFGEAFLEGIFVSLLYILIKCMYLANVAGQFFLLNQFLGSKYRLWGYEVLKAKYTGEDYIHLLGDAPLYTLQCHLPINPYNEKIYLFIWFYFLVVALVTVLNIVYYLAFFLPTMRVNAVRGWLKHLPEYWPFLNSRAKKNTHLLKSFAHKSLNYDGVLLFTFIADHAGQDVAIYLLGPLFETFLVDNKIVEERPPPPPTSVRVSEQSDHSAPKKESNESPRAEEKSSWNTRTTVSSSDEPTFSDEWSPPPAGPSQSFVGVAVERPPETVLEEKLKPTVSVSAVSAFQEQMNRIELAEPVGPIACPMVRFGKVGGDATVITIEEKPGAEGNNGLGTTTTEPSNNASQTIWSFVAPLLSTSAAAIANIILGQRFRPASRPTKNPIKII